MFDLIGDIHGHADKLEALLKKLGYATTNGYYTHPGRKALFVGDYIDRGPKIPETLQLVRGMVDNDSAIASNRSGAEVKRWHGSQVPAQRTTAHLHASYLRQPGKDSTREGFFT